MLRFRTPAGLVAGLGCIAYCGGCITPAMLAVGVQLVKEWERKAAGGSGGKRERTTREEKALMRFRRIFRGKNQRQKNASSQRSGGYDVFSCFLVLHIPTVSTLQLPTFETEDVYSSMSNLHSFRTAACWFSFARASSKSAVENTQYLRVLHTHVRRW